MPDISKMGDKYLRRLFVVGITFLVRRAQASPTPSIRVSSTCSQGSRCGLQQPPWPIARQGSTGASWRAVEPIVGQRTWAHDQLRRNNSITRL